MPDWRNRSALRILRATSRNLARFCGSFLDQEGPMRKLLLLTAVMAMLIVPATAMASDGYTNVAGITQGGGTSGNQTAVRPVETGGNSLPFTGLNVALVLGAGLVLVAAGLTLRRSTGHRKA